MQTIYPHLQRLEEKTRKRKVRGKKSLAKWIKDRERLQIAEWKHKGTPGYAQF